MISLLEGLATTRAIRRYTDDPIPEADLASILWHATRAPSGSNRQPFRFVVLRDGPAAVEAKALLGLTPRPVEDGFWLTFFRGTPPLRSRSRASTPRVVTRAPDPLA